MKKGDPYTCSMCGGTFQSVWDDEDAKKEYEQNFPGDTWDEDTPVVCDDCFKAMTAIKPLPTTDTRLVNLVYTGEDLSVETEAWLEKASDEMSKKVLGEITHRFLYGDSGVKKEFM